MRSVENADVNHLNDGTELLNSIAGQLSEVEKLSGGAGREG